MTPKLRIALRACAGSSWFGGVNYINNLGFALLDLPEDQRPELWILSEDAHLAYLEFYAELLTKCSGLAFLGSYNPIASLNINCKVYSQHQDLEKDFDAVFPLVSSAWEDCAVALSWIPDFQHMHYPEFFSAEEIQSRNLNFKRATQLAQGLILSSEDARNDLKVFDPHLMAQTWTLPFYSKLDYVSSPVHVRQTQMKYQVSRDYICCINQFWAHKDHKTLFHALQILRSQGHIIPLLCTGAPSDYRHQGHYQSMLQLLQDLGIEDQVILLGHIPREDQIQLIRGSRFVVQPSLFEGWSTVLEDCRSLGKPVLASDLGVHLEQNVAGMRTFERRNAQNLADQLLPMWNELPSGPHLHQEAVAKQSMPEMTQQFALKFCQIVKEFSQSNSEELKVNFPKISIVTPNYNQGAYLEKCIQSVLNQGYPNLEYIVIDGGSTDQSLSIIQKYADRISYWVSEKDSGQSDAINKGLKQSTGEIWAWLNGDDWYEEGALFKVAEAYMQNPQAAAWIGACHRLHDNGWLHYISYPNGLFREHLGNNWNCRQFYQPSCFMNRAMVVECGGLREDLHFTMDIDLFLKLSACGDFVAGHGIWSTALAQTDAKTVKQMDKAFAEHAKLDVSLGFDRGAQNIQKKIAANGAYSNYVPGDSMLNLLAQQNRQTPYEFFDRSDVLYVADFCTPQIKECLARLKQVAETLLERAPSHRILLCGPGVEHWKHICIPSKIEIAPIHLNLSQVKTVIYEGSQSNSLWRSNFEKSIHSEGIPEIALDRGWIPEHLHDGINGFIAQDLHELAFKSVLMCIEPSVFGSMSAMVLLNLKDYHSLQSPNYDHVTQLSKLMTQVSKKPRVHVFLYSWNKCDELKQTLELLAQTSYDNFKIFVLNNGSQDGTLELLDLYVPQWFKEYKIIHLPVNIGAAPARNWLWADPENQSADYIAYFDDDIIFEPDWLNKMIEALEAHPKAGVVGAKILNANGPKTIQHSGGVLTGAGEDWLEKVALWGSVEDHGQFDNLSPRDYVMGCCNLYRASAMREVGDFDIQFSPSQFDDVDHHLRLRLLGWEVLFHGGVEIRHLRNSGGPRNINHLANRFKLSEKFKDKADQILSQGTLEKFIHMHPWVQK